MINESDLRNMSAAERRELAHLLTVIDYPSRLRAIQLSRGRWVGGLGAAIACTVLAAWIVILFLTLNRSFHAQHWKGAWAGFDVIELVAFAATGWAFWHVRQVVIPCLLVTGTLLCCDAWFDVVLDTGTPDVWGSVASALLIELPLAFIMFGAARRLIRLSAVAAMAASGDYGDFEAMPKERLPPLWKVPLFGVGTPERWPGARTGEQPRSDLGGTASQRDRSAEDHPSTEVDRQAASDLASTPWLRIFAEETAADAVIESFGAQTDPRLRESLPRWLSARPRRLRHHHAARLVTSEPASFLSVLTTFSSSYQF